MLGSLEGIHDQIHVILGGNGHMADPDYVGSLFSHYGEVFTQHSNTVRPGLILCRPVLFDSW